MNRMKWKWFSSFGAIVAALVAGGYLAGILAQLLRNYDLWQQAGGLLSGRRSPDLPGTSPAAAFRGLLTLPYGLFGLGLVVLAFLILFFFVLRIGRDSRGTFDAQRNLTYSEEGTYGTAGFMTEAERKYTFSQSQQLSMQTGLIGYLRADFGSNGNEFWTTWNDFRKDLKTDEFKAEFDDVINGLRDGDVLSGRKSMSSYCYSTPDSSFNDDRNHYGIRLDTEKYSYLMRFNPNRGEYNLYCYCYQKEWLNNHLKNAERGIRFIDPHYQEQFRIADGEKISIKLGDGKTMERTCRYIDDYHLEVGTNLYHICEFAELCERNGHTVEPAAKENTKSAKDKQKTR